MHADAQELVDDGEPEHHRLALREPRRDTVIVPMKGRVSIAARFDEAGAWMVHCHINEHAEGGMMGEILVGGAVSKAHGAH